MVMPMPTLILFLFALLAVDVELDTSFALLVADNDVGIDVLVLHDIGAGGPTGVGCPVVDDGALVDDTVADEDHLPTRIDVVGGCEMGTGVSTIWGTRSA